MKKYLQSLITISGLIILISSSAFFLSNSDIKNERFSSQVRESKTSFNLPLKPSELVKKSQSSEIRIELFEPEIQTDNSNSLKNISDKISHFTLNKNNLQFINETKPEKILLPVKNYDGSELILELVRVEIFHNEFKAFYGADNSKQQVNFDKGVHYRGIIKNYKNSIAAISIFKEGIMGLMSSETGNFVIGPVSEKDKYFTDQYVFYNDRDLKIKNELVNCAVTEQQEILYDFLEKKKNKSNSNNHFPESDSMVINCSTPVKIYMEARYDVLVSFGGDLGTTLSYMAGFFNQMATIYANESIPIVFFQYFVWGPADPYGNHQDILTYLSDFNSLRAGSFPAIGDLGMFIMTRPIFPSFNGYAIQIGGLCGPGRTCAQNLMASYNNFPVYSWTVSLATHELGHLMGSVHTHSCVWPGGPIDKCVVTAETTPCYNGAAVPQVGTIMSYCQAPNGLGIDFTLGFGTLPGNAIRAHHNYWCNNCQAMPVELISFSSEIYNNNVVLNWSTAVELNNSGFDIERSYNGDDYKKINFIQGNGNSNSQLNYTFTDKNLNSGLYKYRLKQIDYNGNFEYFNLDNSVSIGTPGKITLNQNYPNPFNPVTNISFEISSNAKISLKIYDLSGKLINTLISDIEYNSGYYSISFNGSNLSSGIYFYNLEVNGISYIKKMSLIK